MNHSENFQYDSCISKGICSISPRTSSLIAVLIIYLRLTAKYCLRLCKKTNIDSEVKNLILSTIPLAVTSQEISDMSFMDCVNQFKKLLPQIIKSCNDFFEDDDFKHEEVTSSELFTKTENIIDSIKLGERILNITISSLPSDIRDLHMTAMVISKSLSINLMDLESLGKYSDEAFDTILKLLDSIETEENNDKLINTIKNAVVVNNSLMFKLREEQENQYGKQGISEVSYSTTPNKAILVAGSNIKELEIILEGFKTTNIDIYTHDDMMTAHTFPKFAEYKALKGQYGQGLENCLIDFATFPGPIILTKHSLHNIENLYRGLLFTTDNIVPKGVVKIENYDFKEVITSALNSKGFKRGKSCETVTIGYEHDKTIEEIRSRINSGIKRIFFIGLELYSLEQRAYFDKLIKLTPEDTLIISFSYNSKRDNLIFINTCFDSFGLVKIAENIKDCGLPITIFMPKCDRNTVSEMIYFSSENNIKVYAGKCTPMIINPSLIQTLNKIFGIKSITNVKEDLKDITAS